MNKKENKKKKIETKRNKENLSGKNNSAVDTVKVPDYEEPADNEAEEELVNEKRSFDYSSFCFYEFSIIIGAIAVFLPNTIIRKVPFSFISFFLAFYSVGAITLVTVWLTRLVKSRKQVLAGVVIGMGLYTVSIYMLHLAVLCYIFIVIGLYVTVKYAVFVLMDEKINSRNLYFSDKLALSFYISRRYLAALSILACIVIPYYYLEFGNW